MIKCISVDDEPRAIDVISIHASKIDGIEITESFTDPQRALDYLKSNYTDVIFLDINMPGISGLEFIDRLQFKPYIIFTTAYSEYAIDSYEYEAVDYLLKPIEFDRFYKAIQKVDKLVKLNLGHRNNLLEKSFFVKDGYKKVRVQIEEILYIKGEGNYLQIVCSNEKVMARMTFQQLLEILPESIFLRIHNSYIINLCHIEKIEDNHIFTQKGKIPIGQRYKEDFEYQINMSGQN